MTDEPGSLILQLLREMRAEIAGVRDELKSEVAGVRDELTSEIRSLRADLAADLIVFEAKAAREHKQTRDQVVELRRAVIEYHTAVVGHGLTVGDLEARVRRLEADDVH